MREQGGSGDLEGYNYRDYEEMEQDKREFVGLPHTLKTWTLALAARPEVEKCLYI